jgi:dihydropteroate synthase
MVKLVGILNVTPDSFSDGGLYFDPQAAIDRAEAIFREGAHLLDVGAESTRPGAVPLSPDEEWSRLEPILSALLPRYPNRITLDTYQPDL